MNRQTVRRVQRWFRVLGLSGWGVFLLAVLFFMGGLAPRETMALTAGGGIALFTVGTLFGGVLRKWV